MQWFRSLVLLTLVVGCNPIPPDTSPPAPPGSLNAIVVSSSQINLSWTASSDNVGVSGYRVERCQGATCTNFMQIAAPTGNTYSDTGLAASTPYRYRVRATDTSSNFSAYSPVASATTQAATGPTITASSCALADVQAAINAAQDGYTVVIPAGSCTWTAGATLVGKGIRLKGTVKGAVTLTHNAGQNSLLSVTEDDNHSLEISNLRFVEGASSADNLLQVNQGGGRPVLLHDNYFETNGKMLRSVRWTVNRGVVWNNEFYSNKQDDQAIVIVNNNLDSSWSTPDTLGTRDITGESNLYIEDNLFRQIRLQALDPDSNARVVIRYNIFDNSAIASHGADTSQDGVRHWEVYNNTFTFTNFGDCNGSQTLPLNWFFYIRGGTGVIADNTWADINSCAWGNKPEINMTIQNLRRNSGPYPCWTTYPAPRQVGQSHNGTGFFTDPVYIWGNTGGGNSQPALSDYSPNECGAGAPLVSQFIQAGRDFIVGTPKPGYAKYPHPHPLRSTVAMPAQ